MVVLGGGGCTFIVIDFSHVIFILSKRRRGISENGPSTYNIHLGHDVGRIRLTRTAFVA